MDRLTSFVPGPLYTDASAESSHKSEGPNYYLSNATSLSSAPVHMMYFLYICTVDMWNILYENDWQVNKTGNAALLSENLQSSRV